MVGRDTPGPTNANESPAQGKSPLERVQGAVEVPRAVLESAAIFASWSPQMQAQFCSQYAGIQGERARILYSMVRSGMEHVDISGAVKQAAGRAKAAGKAHPEKVIAAAGWLTVPLIIALGWTTFSMWTGMGLQEGIGYSAVRTIQATAPTPETRSNWQDLWNAWQRGDWKKVNELMPDVVETTYDVFAGHALDLGITTAAVGIANAVPEWRKKRDKERREGRNRIKKPTAKIVTFGGGAAIKALTQHDEKKVYHIVGRVDEKTSIGLEHGYVNLDLANGDPYDDSLHWDKVYLDKNNLTKNHLLIVASGTTNAGMLSTASNAPELRSVGLRNLRQGTEWLLYSVEENNPELRGKVTPVPILITRNTTVTDARTGDRTRKLQDVAESGRMPVLILDPLKELAKELMIQLNHNGIDDGVVNFTLFSRNPDLHKLGPDLAALMNIIPSQKTKYKFNPDPELNQTSPIIVIESKGSDAIYTTDYLPENLGREVIVVACDDKVGFSGKARRKSPLDRQMKTVALGEVLADKIEIIQRRLSDGASIAEIKRDYGL